MEENILAILRALFEDDSIDRSCSQKNCAKWDSMNQLNLVLELEDAFDVSLEPEEIGGMICFNDIFEILRSKGVE